MITTKYIDQKEINILLTSICLIIIIYGCAGKDDTADAYGNFEAKEVTVSSQAQGELLALNINEGQFVKRNDLAGVVDTILLSINRERLLAREQVIRARSRNTLSQINIQEEQMKNMTREKNRLERLIKDNAATQQQLDDVIGKINVMELNIESINQQNDIVIAELKVLKNELKQISNQISKCKIYSPVNGTIIEKYKEQGEIVAPGHPIFKIADLREMELKVYVDGSQLSGIKIGDTVTVKIDDKNQTAESLKGKVNWISSEVEFTPKTIQTKEERVNMVYAVKILVKNDGRIKIGMPGEVYFNE
jgi:HlyD family secretion protein